MADGRNLKYWKIASQFSDSELTAKFLNFQYYLYSKVLTKQQILYRKKQQAVYQKLYKPVLR